MNKTEEANEEKHYILIVFAVIVGLSGVYLRFINEAHLYTWIANILLILGVAIALRAIFAILK